MMTAVRRRFAPPWALALAAYLLIACALFSPAWSDPGRFVIGSSPRDRQQVIWFQVWITHAIGHLQNPFVSDALSTPSGLNLMWNTSPIPAILSWPLRTLFGLGVASNLMITLGVALSALAGYLAARRYVRNTVVAAFSGLLYGFSPFMMGHASHLLFVWTMSLPILVILLDEIVVRGGPHTRRNGICLGLVMAWQILFSEEIAVVAAVAALVALATLWVVVRRAPDVRRLATAAFFALVTFVPLTAWPLWMQFFGPARPSTTLVDAAFFDVDAHQLLFGGDNWASVGIPMLAVVLFSLWRHWHRRDLRVFGLSGLIVTTFVLGGHLHWEGVEYPAIRLPWLLGERLPLTRFVLSPNFLVAVFLFFALAIGIALDEAWRRARWERVLMAAGAVVVALSVVPPIPFPRGALYAVAPDSQTAADPVPFFAGGDSRRIPEDSVALVVPISENDGRYSAQAMVWQAQADMRFKMPGGYAHGATASTFSLPTLKAGLDAIDSGGTAPFDAATLAGIRDELRQLHVQTVICGPGNPHPDVTIAWLTAIIGAAPSPDQGVDVWWNVDRQK